MSKKLIKKIVIIMAIASYMGIYILVTSLSLPGAAVMGNCRFETADWMKLVIPQSLRPSFF